MTASEFSFLALGLILGAISGAALVELIRARPPSPREVRVTVAHDAIPRRASTLADDAFVAVGPEPARGGPADRREAPATVAADMPERRTTVRYAEPTTAPSMAGAIPITPDPGEPPMPGRVMEPALPLTGIPSTEEPKPPGPEMVAIPISSGEDPMLAALAASIAAAEGRATTGRIELLQTSDFDPPEPSAAATPDAATVPIASLTAVGLLDRPAPPAAAGTTPAETGRCAEERRIADERCELATRARARADAAADALRLAQRTYDAHEAAAVTAAWRTDPRAIHEAKEAAQGGFRAAVAAATTPDELEAAARDWLSEINRINTDAREAQTTVAREHAAAAEIGGTLERLGLEADAARIGAENADAACLAARVAVAECDERATDEADPPLIAPVSGDDGERLEEDETLGLAFEAGGAPRIFRLLRGDRAAMTSLVAALAGADPESKRHWQLLMTGLVEAIVADAIEASALDFPEDHPFWGAFTRAQSRDIVRAVSSLGYRFDGLGGWTDERQPSQRDLSLALGYAGLDPMRIRQWPDGPAMTALFADVTVAADEWLAGVAGDLTLAEMVGMLGRRADGLAEVWNQWGRIRPLLLDEA
ncbi:MAG TPA: hypothetical protein VGM28_01995 [Candidatus Limnocylindrales bacterium]